MRELQNKGWRAESMAGARQGASAFNVHSLLSIGQRIRSRAHHRQLEQSMSTIAFVIEEEMIRVVNLCHYESHPHG